MDKNALKKDIKDLNNGDKIKVVCILVVIALIVVAGVLLINKKNDDDLKKKIDDNKAKTVNRWKKSEKVEFNKDNKEVKYYEYCLSTEKDKKDCLWSRTTDSSILIDVSGHKYVYYRLLDANSKVIKEDMQEVFIDNTEPIINEIEQLDEDKVTIRVNAIDNISSIDKYQYSLDGLEYFDGTMTYVFKDLSKDSNQIIYVKVIDMAGNSTTDSIKIGTTQSEQ